MRGLKKTEGGLLGFFFLVLSLTSPLEPPTVMDVYLHTPQQGR